MILVTLGTETGVKCNENSFERQIYFKESMFLTFFRTDIPHCDFPGSDIYVGMMNFFRLDVMYEDFMHNER